MRRALVVAALTCTAVAPARAGWRPVELLLIDAGQGGAAGKRCVDRVATYFTAMGEDVALVRRTLPAVRAKVPAGAPPSVLAWTDAETAGLRARKRDDDFDAVVVLDCRPDARTLDVVVDPVRVGVGTLRLRDVALAGATLDWVAARIFAIGILGFEP